MNDKHDYDGIEEHDNDLPNWWLYLFYITIIFSGYYMYQYHWGGTGVLPVEAYNLEAEQLALEQLNKPAEKKDYTDEDVIKLAQDPEAIKNGLAVYKSKCIACHGQSGEGSVGPNLTDDFWIHGGAPLKIVTTIAKGVPEKGMIAWEGLLTQKEIIDVTAYIKSIHGTNPSNAKAPQGNKETL